MPQYVQKVTPVKARASSHSEVVSGEMSIETGWEQIKGVCPLFTGQLHSEAHEKYSDDIIKLIGTNNNFKTASDDDKAAYQKADELIVWTYIEDTEYDEERMIFSFNIVEYYKSQADLDKAEKLLEATEKFKPSAIKGTENESTIKVVDFHRPYPS